MARSSRLIDVARAAYQKGDPEEAARLCRKIVTSCPRDGEALELLGTALFDRGRYKEAAEALQRAVAHVPHAVAAHSLLAIACGKLGQAEKAERHFARAVETCPPRAAELDALARLLYEQGALAHAETCMRRTIALEPRHAGWHSNLALILKGQGRIADAEASCRHALALAPDHAGALQNLGVLLFDRQALDEAAAHLEHALRLQPAPEAIWHLGLVNLLQGRYREGFAMYEARFAVRKSHPKDYPQPMWDGAARPDATLLVYHEQGLGDTLQFARFLPLARSRVGRIVFVCQAPLVRLFEGFPGVDAVVESESPAERPAGLAADLQISLLSLPHVLGITLADLPVASRYVHPTQALARRWQERLAGDWGFKVGIAWAGNPVNPRDAVRSCTLQDFAPLAGVDGVTFYSLQKGPGSEQAAAPPPGMALVDPTADLHDLAETAALIAHLDLVITVDTSVAHLAAAMGKPTWTLHSRHADWRWMVDRADTPWYPSMRLFRQGIPGDWGKVFASAAGALQRWLEPAAVAASA